MYIGAVPTAENASYDTFMVAHLRSWGYTVEVHYESDLKSYEDADYVDYDFIFLSESIISDSAARLIEIPKPMLCSEGWAAKEDGLAFGLGYPCDMMYALPVKFLAAGEQAIHWLPDTLLVPLWNYAMREI